MNNYSYDDDPHLQEILEIQRREENLRKLMNETQCEIIQENGQRKLGGPPPNWVGPPPPKGCEVFIGKIPRNVYEDELFRLFSKIGPIYELRLMMDFSGSNRGFAFVQYTNRKDANRAIQELDKYELRPRHHIGVVKSIDNCRLFVGGIPKDKTQEEVWAEIERLTDGVSQVIVYSSITDKTKNRGFAFVEYVNHRAASKARRKLIPDRIHLWGKEIAVDWAEPEGEIDDDIMAKVTVLYVRNLSLTTTEHVLHEIFSRVSGGNVQKVKMMRDFAFVHFSSREAAVRAMETLNNTEINGTRVEISWAKPARERKQSDANRKPPSRKSSTASIPYSLSPTKSSPPLHDTSPINFTNCNFIQNAESPVTNLNLQSVTPPPPIVFPKMDNMMRSSSISIPPPPLRPSITPPIPNSFGFSSPVPSLPSPPLTPFLAPMDFNGNQNSVNIQVNNLSRNIPTPTLPQIFYPNYGFPVQSPFMLHDGGSRFAIPTGPISMNVPPLADNMALRLANLNCHEMNRNVNANINNLNSSGNPYFMIPPFGPRAFH